MMSFLKSFPPPSPEDGLRQQQPDTEAVLDGKGLGTGTLYIAESRLSWLDGAGIGFSLDYPTISLHAVSRDLNAYPQEHLYVMVNARFGEEEPKELKETPMAEGEEDEDSDEDIEPIAEFRFVPSDKSALEALFAAMCECQALHPDPEDEDSDDYDGEEYDVEAHEGQATLERLEGMLAQSVSSQYNMAGVRTEDSIRDYEDGMEIDTTPTVAGQFEDADVDH
ncbi:methylosome subunit pICln isoform X2 [Petaurus breviceps papuanus]|uniref:methylosome subunit pICln isoform X2 n=1 Tax=Petaurus breviceps papuanus TaxID=3040969 RepID=UPI0036DE3722